jgi:hypothetical protein
MVVELQGRPNHRRSWGRPVLAAMSPGAWASAAAAGALSFPAAWLAIPLTTPEGVAQFWPAAGIAVGFLIISGRTARWPVAAAIAVASFLANALAGRSGFACSAFALGNTGKCPQARAFSTLTFSRAYR